MKIELPATGQAMAPRQKGAFSDKVDMGPCTHVELPPWSDVSSLLSELSWLRTWTRHLEETNERLLKRRTIELDTRF